MPSTQLWRQFKKNRAAAISLYFVIAFILAAIFASELSPYDPFALGDGALLAPQSDHWMGTDDLGRDTLSRVIHGTRVPLLVGFLATACFVIARHSYRFDVGLFRRLDRCHTDARH